MDYCLVTRQGDQSAGRSENRGTSLFDEAVDIRSRFHKEQHTSTGDISQFPVELMRLRQI